jgi:predicted transcriptional regulator
VLAEKKIVKLLDEVGEKGILQSEIPRILNLSKSTVSEILSSLETEEKIIRKSVSARSYRVWKVEYFPTPHPNLLRLGILKSSEYAYLIIAALEKRAIIKIFNDPIDLTKALSQGKIDMAASPILTQVIMGILMKNFRIVRIIAKNGSGIVFSDCHNGIFGTTEMSTMDRNLRKFLSMYHGKVHYFNSPENMIKSLKEREIEGLAIWEPYLSMLKEQGFKVKYFKDIVGEFICCSLAVNIDSLSINGDRIREFLAYYDKICNKKLRKKDYNVLAEILKFNSNLIEKSVKSYSFCPKSDVNEIKFYIRDSGIDLSDESLLSVVDI